MDNEKLLKLYPDYTKVHGPYSRGDGRKHIVLNNTNLPKGSPGKLRTVSYPKALKEIELGRVLGPDETVDHNDRNFNNNDSNNMIVRDRSEHSSLDATRVEVEKVFCIVCDTHFEPSRNQHTERSNNSPGPFCSKQCTGMFNKAVQAGKIEKTPREIVSKSYYKVEKK